MRMFEVDKSPARTFMGSSRHVQTGSAPAGCSACFPSSGRVGFTTRLRRVFLAGSALQALEAMKSNPGTKKGNSAE